MSEPGTLRNNTLWKIQFGNNILWKSKFECCWSKLSENISRPVHGACVLCNGPETPSYWLRATLVGDILFVTCGWDDVTDDFTSILSWNPVAESWLPAGDLAVERFSHAAVPKLRSYVVATLRD